MGAVLTESLSTAPAPAAPGTASGGSHHRARPAIIQGGMGVAVSGWRLAREVSRTGHLGVVSGTAMDAVLARRLQDGDAGGHYRRALVHFPSPAIVERVLERYFVDGRPSRGCSVQAHPQADRRRLARRPGARRPRELRRGVAGEGGPCRRRRRQLPREGPDGHPDRRPRGDARGGRLRAHGRRHPARGAPAARLPRGRRGRAASPPTSRAPPSSAAVEVDPAGLLGADLPPLTRPDFLAIVSPRPARVVPHRDAAICPDGFVVERPPAGGHSAPPRGADAARRARRPGLRRHGTRPT